MKPIRIALIMSYLSLRGRSGTASVNNKPHLIMTRSYEYLSLLNIL